MLHVKWSIRGRHPLQVHFQIYIFLSPWTWNNKAGASWSVHQIFYSSTGGWANTEPVLLERLLTTTAGVKTCRCICCVCNTGPRLLDHRQAGICAPSKLPAFWTLSAPSVLELAWWLPPASLLLLWHSSSVLFYNSKHSCLSFSHTHNTLRHSFSVYISPPFLYTRSSLCLLLPLSCFIRKEPASPFI